MTNEQLALFIKQGDSNELIPILWERVRKLMYMLSNRYYRAYNNKLAAYGIASDDLKAAAYPAFLKAIDSFEEDKGHSFISYLKYPLKNEFRKIWTKDILNSADSLNITVASEDGKALERIELIEDETSLDFVEQADRDSIGEAVRAAVRKLPPEKQDFIRRRFYNRNTLNEIAQIMGKSTEAVRQYEKKLLQELRRNKYFFRLKNELGYDSQRVYHNSYGSYRRRGISNVETVAIQRADIYLQIRKAALFGNI